MNAGRRARDQTGNRIDVHGMPPEVTQVQQMMSTVMPTTPAQTANRYVYVVECGARIMALPRTNGARNEAASSRRSQFPSSGPNHSSIDC